MLRWLRSPVLPSAPVFLFLFAFLSASTLRAETVPVELSAAFNVTSLGFRANEGGGGALGTGWTGGNLGNTWIEGEWVPYQLVLTSVQSSYPNLAGLPDIVISYDFHKSGARFVDLVRGIQAGRRPLANTEAWPMDNGLPYPIATRAQIEAAQSDVGNAAPFDNVWQLGGTGNFQLLTLPNARINRALDGTDGTPTSDRRKFTVTAADLLGHGIPATADTIVIYYQLHESRSFVWNNALQAALANPPTGPWGGYLYANAPFSTDRRPGSSFVPGSSGHVHLESLSGSQDVPIPIPERLPGALAGVKWQDDNGNGVRDGGEPTLSGWRIKVSGTVDNINFTTTTLTDGSGAYSFPDLTNGTWTLSEAVSREVPFNAGFNQTYPNAGSAPVGVGVRTPIAQAGQADWGWSVALTKEMAAQGGLDFGNRACIDAGATALTDLTKCPGETAVFSTTASGTGPFSFVWKKGTSVLSSGGNISIVTNNDVSTLTLTGVSAGDATGYSVEVTGACGPAAVRSATLTVNTVVAATALTDMAKCAGETAVFSTTASGTGPYTFIWKKGTTVLSSGGNISIVTAADASTLTITNVAAADAGQYCVTVSGACGDPVEPCASLSVNAAVGATALNPLTKCPGEAAVYSTTASGTGPFSFIWKKGATVLSSGGNISIVTNSNVSTLTINSVAAGDAGNYCVTVSGACGSDVNPCADLTVNVAVSATALNDETKCSGESAVFSTTASGTGPFGFVWKKGSTVLSTGGNISIVTDGNVSTLTLSGVAAADTGQYCVTVSGACDPPATRCGTLNLLPNVSTTELGRVRACEGFEAGLSTTASGSGPFTFVWTKGDVVLSSGGNMTIATNGNTSSLVLGSAGTDDAGTYCVTVSGSCGPPAISCGTLSVGECVEFCSLTQGFYGNKGGKQCYEGRKLGTLELLDALIPEGNPLVVGKPGRSLRVTDGNEECLLKRLPGGGPPETLPAGLGDAAMTGPACTVPASMLKNGRFNNVLLSQTITLGLNLRFDTTLGNLTLCRTMVTVKAVDGGDGCIGSPDDVPAAGDVPVRTVHITQSVFTALTSLSLPHTPVGILELANRALAGQPAGGASLPAISGAADAINSGFDECRFIFECSNEEDVRVPVTRSVIDISGDETVPEATAPPGLRLLGNRPNPFTGATSIRFALPERSRVRISVFNIAGEKVRWSADREMEAGEGSIEWNAAGDASVPAGIYFYRLESDGLETGSRAVRTGKMILAK